MDDRMFDRWTLTLGQRLDRPHVFRPAANDLATFGPAAAALDDVDAATEKIVYLHDYAKSTRRGETADCGLRASSVHDRAFGLSAAGMNGGLNWPHGVATDSAGNAYVTDGGNHRVQKFDSNGYPIFSWGSYGSGPGEFDWPAGIAVSGNDLVYVVDKDNHRVQVFDGDGALQGAWGREGTGDGEFSHPEGIAIDAAGNVFVVDANNGRIQTFSGAGVYQGQFPAAGRWPSTHSHPMGIAIDDAGTIYIADGGNHTVQKFSRSGRYLTSWDAPGALGIATDRAGNVFVTGSCPESRLQKFSSSGALLMRSGASGDGHGECAGPLGLTLDSDGDVCLVEAGHGRIQTFEVRAGARANAWHAIQPILQQT